GIRDFHVTGVQTCALPIYAGPLHAGPCPVVFSTSQGAFASTPMRSTPAFLMASIRGLAPGAGTGTSAKAGAHSASATSSTKLRRSEERRVGKARRNGCEQG